LPKGRRRSQERGVAGRSRVADKQHCRLWLALTLTVILVQVIPLIRFPSSSSHAHQRIRLPLQAPPHWQLRCRQGLSISPHKFPPLHSCAYSANPSPACSCDLQTTRTRRATSAQLVLTSRSEQLSWRARPSSFKLSVLFSSFLLWVWQLPLYPPFYERCLSNGTLVQAVSVLLCDSRPGRLSCRFALRQDPRIMTLVDLQR
jgi:hypothetical protein